MNHVIASISFHIRDHAHVLALIDKMSREHPTMTRSAIVRSMILDGGDAQILKMILIDYQNQLNELTESAAYSWRESYDNVKRRQQGQT